MDGAASEQVDSHAPRYRAIFGLGSFEFAQAISLRWAREAVCRGSVRRAEVDFGTALGQRMKRSALLDNAGRRFWRGLPRGLAFCLAWGAFGACNWWVGLG